MPGSLIPDLLDLFPDEITVHRYQSSDAYGEDAFDEANPVTAQCRYTGRIRTITGADGEEHVSMLHAAVAGVYGFTARDRYTVPAAYGANPNDPSDLEARRPKAKAVTRTSDESGPHHEKIFFAWFLLCMAQLFT